MADPVSDELAGAVAIVTAAAGGVGRPTVEFLIERDASVVAEDLNPAVGELENERVATWHGDVAEPDTARQAVALAKMRFGALHVIVNDAGRVPVNAVAPGADCGRDRVPGLGALSIITGAILMADGGFTAQ
jgi:NAD(P)-dependent dehydrogenase (short-subunit alcohol dehydrogenase family)